MLISRIFYRLFWFLKIRWKTLTKVCFLAIYLLGHSSCCHHCPSTNTHCYCPKTMKTNIAYTRERHRWFFFTCGHSFISPNHCWLKQKYILASQDPSATCWLKRLPAPHDRYITSLERQFQAFRCVMGAACYRLYLYKLPWRVQLVNGREKVNKLMTAVHCVSPQIVDFQLPDSFRIAFVTVCKV